MHDNTAEDENFNTSCIGRAIHTPTTHGLITRTYMPLTHWQILCLQILLRLDDLQYKETARIPQMILIPSSLWLFNTLQKLLQSTVPFASIIQTRFLPSTHHTTAQQSQWCPTPPPPSLSLPALRPLPTVLEAPLMSSPPLLWTALPVTRWPFPTSKWSSTSLISSTSRKKKSTANSPLYTPCFPLTGPLLLPSQFSPLTHLCWLTPIWRSMISTTTRVLFHLLHCHIPELSLSTMTSPTSPTVPPFPVPNHFPFLPLTFMTASQWHHPSPPPLTPLTPCQSYRHSSKTPHLVLPPLSLPWPWYYTNRPRLTYWKPRPWTQTLKSVLPVLLVLNQASSQVLDGRTTSTLSALATFSSSQMVKKTSLPPSFPMTYMPLSPNS